MDELKDDPTFGLSIGRRALLAGAAGIAPLLMGTQAIATERVKRPAIDIVKVANTERMSWSSANTTGEKQASQLAPDGAIDYSVKLSEPTIVGNHLWLTTEATTFQKPADPSKKPRYYKELITNHGPLDAIADRRNSHVDATASYTLVMDWRPWMGFDDLSGQTVDHAI